MTAVDFVKRFVETFDKLQIPYMAVDSFSSNVYGTPRATNDADFVVEMTAAAASLSMSRLAQELAPDFLLDPQMAFETITATSRQRFQHRASAFMVEVFLLSDDPYDRERFARRIAGNIGGRDVFVPTPEDVVIQKLRWSLHGQRAKDIEDVRGVLAVQAGRLDLAYIRPWCDEHGTRAVFERLLLESEQR